MKPFPRSLCNLQQSLERSLAVPTSNPWLHQRNPHGCSVLQMALLVTWARARQTCVCGCLACQWLRNQTPTSPSLARERSSGYHAQLHDGTPILPPRILSSDVCDICPTTPLPQLAMLETTFLKLSFSNQSECQLCIMGERGNKATANLSYLGS